MNVLSLESKIEIKRWERHYLEQGYDESLYAFVDAFEGPSDVEYSQERLRGLRNALASMAIYWPFKEYLSERT